MTERLVSYATMVNPKADHGGPISNLLPVHPGLVVATILIVIIGMTVILSVVMYGRRANKYYNGPIKGYMALRSELKVFSSGYNGSPPPLNNRDAQD